MADREQRIIGAFGRNNPARNSIGPSSSNTRRYFQNSETTTKNNLKTKNPDRERSRDISVATRHYQTPGIENLKQWELVQGDRGLRVVEKRIDDNFYNEKFSNDTNSSLTNDYENLPEELMQKFKAFENSSIVQALPRDCVTITNAMNDETVKNMKKSTTAKMSRNDNEGFAGAKVPISLDAILSQKRNFDDTGASSSIAKIDNVVASNDMLDQLERQVKAIELGTIEAARNKKKIDDSCDFEPEIQLRYREHEDLLRNVTDDEAEG